VQVDSQISHAPIVFEEAHSEVAYLAIAAEFAVVVRLAGSVAPVVVEAVLAVAPAAAAEVSADHLGTPLRLNPPIQHMDLSAVRKSSQEKRQGTMRANTPS
jgi:NAD-dependent DNA ligase